MDYKYFQCLIQIAVLIVDGSCQDVREQDPNMAVLDIAQTVLQQLEKIFKV